MGIFGTNRDAPSRCTATDCLVCEDIIHKRDANALIRSDIWSPAALLDFTLTDLKRSSSRSLIFQTLLCLKVRSQVTSSGR